MRTIRIASLNCFGLAGNCEGYVADVCKQADLVALQETWLHPWQINLPSSLGEDICSFSVSSINVSDEIRVGRPFGGLTFIWQRSMSPIIKIRQYDCDRILGLSVTFGGTSVLFLNVYFPVNSNDNLEEYLSCMGVLGSILESREEQQICVLGDFNASPHTARFVEIEELFAEYNVAFQDTRLLPPDTYTHVNHGSLSTSWIDHVALSTLLLDATVSCYTLPDVACTDHCVIGVTLNVEKMQTPLQVVSREVRAIDWNFKNKVTTDRFYVELDTLLSHIPDRLLGMNERSDSERLNDLYGCMRQCILIAGRRVFGMRKPSKFNVPGWNERAKELNYAVRDAVFQWNVAGKPRGGQLAVVMRIAKSRFRRELAFLRENEQQLRAQALLTKLREGKCKDFWKEIRALNPKKDSLPLTVAGVTGVDNIARVWGEHFRDIANSVATDENREWVQGAISNTPVVNETISVAEVRAIVRGLKNNKAVGNDDIPGEVYKHASHRLITVLALFLSGCIRAKQLPRDVMHVIVIPLLKCKTKDPSDINNYRPIAIATSISKVLEQIILARLQTHLFTADSQFGFKEGHGTEMAIFALKQTVEYYRSRDSPVFMCFLDAKKAFDRVNHWTLFRKLIERGAPPHIVELLVFWYREQEFLVRWGSSKSAPYHCINGIRQGGQLSPLLYNVYTDDLNFLLSSENVGCHVANCCVNNLSYADDMVLVATTLSALQ